MSQNLATLKTAFAEGLGVDEDDIEWDTLEYRSIPEWDSVAHMMVVAEIEDAFDVSITTDDVIAMSSFKVAQDILSKYDVTFD